MAMLQLFFVVLLVATISSAAQNPNSQQKKTGGLLVQAGRKASGSRGGGAQGSGQHPTGSGGQPGKPPGGSEGAKPAGGAAGGQPGGGAAAAQPAPPAAPSSPLGGLPVVGPVLDGVLGGGGGRWKWMTTRAKNDQYHCRGKNSCWSRKHAVLRIELAVLVGILVTSAIFPVMVHLYVPHFYVTAILCTLFFL